MENIKYVPMYKSYIDAVAKLNPEDRLIIYEAIFEYGFTGKEPEFDNPYLEMGWELVKPNLVNNIKNLNKNIENGKKGGRPKKKSKIEPKVESKVESKVVEEPSSTDEVHVQEVEVKSDSVTTTPQPEVKVTKLEADAPTIESKEVIQDEVIEDEVIQDELDVEIVEDIDQPIGVGGVGDLIRYLIEVDDYRLMASDRNKIRDSIKKKVVTTFEDVRELVVTKL